MATTVKICHAYHSRSQEKRTNTLITLAGRAADPHRPHPCDDDRRLAVAVGLANLPLLPTTSFPAFVFIVLIICMLTFRIFAESCQSRATSSWNCPRIQSKLAHCPTVVGGFIQRTLEASIHGSSEGWLSDLSCLHI